MAQLPDPVYVTKYQSLKGLAEACSREPVIAVDTESNSMFAYKEQVCLIQISTPEADYLIDTLELEDLSPLGPVFADPAVEKVFHAAEYDLICLQRDYGFEFANLFDTMVASRILGREKVGLGSILENVYGVKLDKRYQRANWGQRPLPPDLLAYARLDTHYLIPLHERLKKELETCDRWPLAEEDFIRACRVNQPELPSLEERLWRKNGVRDLSPQQIAALFELFRYREQVAQSRNRPVFKVIGDKTLMAIAEVLPEDETELSELPGMSRGQMKRHAHRLLACVRRGMGANPPKRPRHTRADDDFIDRLDSLRNWRKRTARQMEVESDVVLPRDLMHTLARQNPAGREELQQVMQEVPYRFKHYGEEILRVMR